MHIVIASASDIDRLQLPELDTLRHHLRMTKAELCREAEIDPTTYQRWMRNVRGQRGGTTPNRRSVAAVREVLRRRLCEASENVRLAS